MFSASDQTFTQTVLESPTLVLANFWAPWCGLCRRITPILSAIEREYESSLHVVSVNADENFKLANRYRLMTLPTLLLFERGQVIHRVDSIYRLDLLQQELRQAVNQHTVAALSSIR